MFKKLRNKLLIVNTLIIASLVLGSFSVIYFMTARNVNMGISQRLDRAINLIYSERAPKPKNDLRNPKLENEAIEDITEMPPNPEVPPNHNEEEKQMFSLTFTIITDTYGNISKINVPFELDEDFYSDKMQDIICSKNGEGQIKSDSGYWAYKVSPLDNGYVAAFTEYHTEHTMLWNLFLILMLVGLGALTAAFLISLFSANRSIRPVEESFNKQKQFVADASHELKTPLTTINTNVDVLLSHPASSIGEERKWLDYIKTEAERMNKLTNDLLYLAKLDHSGGNIIFSKVSFSEAAESVILLMEAVVFENEVTLTYNITPDVYVKCSYEQLKQLVMILLDNAVKYTPKSGNIKISLVQESADAVLKVRNSGEGISDEAQKHIFDRFYREDKSRARESGGYGLGLAIAKAVVTSCKGNIRVISEKNHYTEFIVKIPIVK